MARLAHLWIFFLMMTYVAGHAQVKFTTVVPRRTVAPGESFQVQYILENTNEVSDFLAPPFDGFRLVSGPNVYSGSRSSPKRNVVFTLAALNEGRFKVIGAICVVNGKRVKSNDAFVQVASEKDTEESPYFLRLGEDPLQKIKQNLFLKLIVDKHSCFIGEPLVATFKLYSRLQSRSNVIKNPGFYGFSVYDMVDVNDQILSEEKLDGHWFQVHTIRKVQLYPLQPGAFAIDPMELTNEVEFSRSVVDKKTEQEVTEKMYGDEDDKKQASSAAEVYQVNLKTDPLVIKVNALPRKNSADTFAGAVGNFAIQGVIEKGAITPNEENYLTIAINGSGNFQRVSAPVVPWPSGVEGFEPIMTDTLDRQAVPLTGRRNFKYAFSSADPGRYTIPAVAFSYFDVKTRTYKTVSTKPVTFIVKSVATAQRNPVNMQILSRSSEYQRHLWIIPAALLLIVAILVVLWRSLRYRRAPAPSGTPIEDSSFSVDEILQPAQTSLGKEDKVFYRELNGAIWNYLKYKIGISGSQVNKESVERLLLSKKIKPDVVNNLVELIHQSEVATYTSASMDLRRKEIFQKTRTVLEAIDNECN